MLWQWILQVTGIHDQGTGPWYMFWSGFGGDIGEVAIVGGLAAIYRKNTCHEPWCARLAKHPVTGTPFMVCRKHHPALPGRKGVRGEIEKAYKDITP